MDGCVPEDMTALSYLFAGNSCMEFVNATWNSSLIFCINLNYAFLRPSIISIYRSVPCSARITKNHMFVCVIFSLLVCRVSWRVCLFVAKAWSGASRRAQTSRGWRTPSPRSCRPFTTSASCSCRTCRSAPLNRPDLGKTHHFQHSCR